MLPDATNGKSYLGMTTKQPNTLYTAIIPTDEQTSSKPVTSTLFNE
jgi:hypothetical protein